MNSIYKNEVIVYNMRPMSAIDLVINAVDEIPDHIGSEQVELLADADDFLFEYNSAVLREDADRYIKNGGNLLGVISAHPDPVLAQERQEVLDTELYITPKHGLPHLNKGRLGYWAGKEIIERNLDVGLVAVGDDRFINGAVSEKYGLIAAGVPAIAIFLDAPDARPHNPLDVVLGKIQSIGARAAKFARVDTLIRPAA